MNFKKYKEIIKAHKYDMTFLIIYYYLQCNDEFNNAEEFKHNKHIECLISVIYSAYMKDENKLDLGYICDKAVEYKDEILNNEDFNKWDLLKKCYIEQ
ncbi:MAG: hypothetical protein IJN13_00380 [Bacilli bacterium]|nr:hypothetical protein [Bacilli bacterium]